MSHTKVFVIWARSRKHVLGGLVDPSRGRNNFRGDISWPVVKYMEYLACC